MMRAFLALAFVFICLSAPVALAQNDAVTDDDVMKALHGGGTPKTAAPREYAPAAASPGDNGGDEQPSAKNDETAAPPAAPATTAAPPSSDKGSLKDLKDAQDAADNADAPPPLQAIGEGAQVSCPSREVAATVKMPDTTKFYSADGSNEKARKCETAFQKLPDACADDNPCTDCDQAVKAYSDACTYVENKEDMHDMELPGANNPRREQAPVTRIPYQQSGKP